MAAPLSLTGFWLQTGLFAMAAAIGAIGLTLLVGVTGQLSLGHAFFVAVGAYGYAFLAGAGAGRWRPGLPDAAGRGRAACILAGAAGALFSPIAGRLRGIYLGLASLGLVFLGQHILHNASAVTGGFNGRDVAPFDLFGFSFTATDPDLVVLGVPYGSLERLWYLGLVLLGAVVLVCPQPPARATGSGARRRARQRGRRRRDGRGRAAVQGRRVHRLLGLRGPGRCAARPGVRPDRAGQLRLRSCPSTSSQ